MFSSWKLKASCGCKMTYYSSGCYRNNNFVDSNGRSGKSTKGSFLGLEEVSSSMGVRMRMPPAPRLRCFKLGPQLVALFEYV